MVGRVIGGRGRVPSLLVLCLVLSACGGSGAVSTTAVPNTMLPPTTTSTTTTVPPTTLPPPTTTTTTIPFPERLRSEIAAFNLLVACLEETVADMDVAALVSAVASELAVYNRAQLNRGVRFFELEAQFLRCLPELPVYASARVELGEGLDGVLDYEDDVDVFVFQATENEFYEIGVALGTLSDSIVTVYDGDETELGRNDDHEGLSASYLLWRAPATDDFYVVVEGYGAGSYTVTVELSDIVDDHPDQVGGEVPRVELGEALDGVLDYEDDVDVFVFQATENEFYEIGVALGTLSDSIVTVYDGDETELGRNDDEEGSLASYLLWRAPATDDFYVVVEGYGAGSYTVTVELSDIVDDHPDQVGGEVPRVELGEVLDGVLDYEDDVDVFVFQATENEFYEIGVALGTLSDSIVTVYDGDETELAWNDDHEGSLASYLLWRAPATDDFYVVVEGYGAGSYTVTVELSDIVDDHADGVEGAYLLQMGDPVDGTLEYPEDVDVFAFEVVAGGLYEIGVGLGTLSDSIVRVYDSGGVELGSNDDHEGSLASLLVWEAPTTAAYYVEVSGYGAGSYTLSVQPTDH